MKKKLITISDELYEIIQKNAKTSELTLMEEIRQTLKTGARYRKKALGVPERYEETPKATSNISKEVPQEKTEFLDDFTDDDIKDTVAAAKEAYHL